MKNKEQSFVTLHSVSYDDPDFGRVLVKPGKLVKLSDADTIRDLKAAKAVRPATAGEAGLKEGADVAEQEPPVNADPDADDQVDGDQDDDGLGDEPDLSGAADPEVDVVHFDVSSLTKAQLKEALDGEGVEYDKNANKDALIELYTAHVAK